MALAFAMPVITSNPYIYIVGSITSFSVALFMLFYTIVVNGAFDKVIDYMER